MSLNKRFTTAGRDSSALAITIALHAGVAAIALMAVNVSMQKQPPPMVFTNHPDVITPPPAQTPPLPTERPVDIAVDAPVITIDNPLPGDFEVTPYDEPPVIGAGDGLSAANPPQPATGPSQPARFDPRHAAARQPPYPAAARRLGEEGEVIVHVRIGADGRVVAATVGRSSGSARLDAAAIDHALKRWRFTPALRDGVAVEAVRDITVNFRLAEA